MGAIITCMNKNFPIFTCNMENGMITEVGEVLDEKHLPIILQDAPLDRPHANAWLKSRKIPDNRDGLKMARRDFPKFEMYQSYMGAHILLTIQRHRSIYQAFPFLFHCSKIA